jgi:ATP-dependent helicase/nuclease subunit A
VLSRLYPKMAVRAALLFTQEPRLLEIPAAAMEAALEARFGSNLIFTGSP